MKEFYGSRLPTGKYHWYQPSPHGKGPLQESLRLNFRVDSSRRDSALSLIANDLADHSEDWAVPVGSPDGPWRINLTKVALRVRSLADQTWLSGERIVFPDFDIVESPYDEPETANGKTAVVRLTLLMDSKALLTSIPSPHELSGFLDRFRGDYADPSRCGFLMMAFEETPAHKAIWTCIQNECASLGLTALRADTRRYSDDLLPNIRTYMHGCSFGIAVFERVTTEHFNPNVSLEVGYMLALGKPVCLLKDKTLKALPTDLVGRLYENFDPQRVEETLAPVLRRWFEAKRLTTLRGNHL